MKLNNLLILIRDQFITVEDFLIDNTTTRKNNIVEEEFVDLMMKYKIVNLGEEAVEIFYNVCPPGQDGIMYAINLEQAMKELFIMEIKNVIYSFEY